MKAISTLLLLGALGTGSTADTLQDIRDTAKQQGAIEVLILKQYPPVDLRTLVTKADLVVRTVVTGSKSFLAGDRVSTDYNVQVLSGILGEDLNGKTIVIRRDGGEIKDARILAYEPDFPFFRVGEEYVLFLKRAPEGHYVIPYGAQGAFNVEGATVSQVSRSTGTWNQERGRVEVLRFLSEIAEAAKQ